MANILNQIFGMAGNDPWQGMRAPNMLTAPQAPQAAPQAAPAAQSSFGQNLMGALPYFYAGLAQGATPNQSIAGAGQMMTQYLAKKDETAAQNQTVEFLKSKGLDEQQAKMIAGNKAALGEYLKSTFAKADPMAELEMQLKQAQLSKMTAGPDPLDQQYKQAQIEKMRAEIEKANSPDARAKLGLQPQYGTDANGNPVLLQIGDDGSAVQTKMPEGVTLSKEPIRLDAGTHWVLLDPISRQPVGQIQKDITGQKAAEARGKDMGDAQASLPAATARTNRTLEQIDQLMAHPGLDSILGTVDQFRPTTMLGAEGNDALARLKQLQGGAFLEAFNMLKGGGQITEIEGQKAENAMARLNRAQDEKTFRTALKDFRDAVQEGYTKLQSRAGVGQMQAPANGNWNDLGNGIKIRVKQ